MCACIHKRQRERVEERERGKGKERERENVCAHEHIRRGQTLTIVFHSILGQPLTATGAHAFGWRLPVSSRIQLSLLPQRQDYCCTGHDSQLLCVGAGIWILVFILRSQHLIHCATWGLNFNKFGLSFFNLKHKRNGQIQKDRRSAVQKGGQDQNWEAAPVSKTTREWNRNIGLGSTTYGFMSLEG